NLHLASMVCDRFGFIKNGELAVTGTMNELIKNLQWPDRVKVSTTNQEFVEEYSNIEEINKILKRIMDSGEYITSVDILNPSLQDVYFHYIGRSEHELA
ncbi:MAG: hypothetical protein ACLFR1_14465, partial [Spirochaetia bacterium]